MKEFKSYPKPEKVLKISKPYRYERKATGEADLFRKVWATRKHECEHFGVKLQNPPLVSYFSHIKSKGAYPELRLRADNIQLLCADCHRIFDQGTKEQFEKRKRA